MVYKKKSTETKNAIKMALLNILEEKAFSTISINDIAEKAHVNRGTFYYHYADKFELIANIEADFFAELDAVHGKILQKSSADPIKDFGSYRFLPDFFNLVAQNSYVLKQLISVNGDPLFERQLKSNFKDRVIDSFASTKVNLTSYNTELVFDFITSALLTVITFWLEHPEIDQASIIKTLTKLLTRGPVVTLLEDGNFE